VGPQLFLPNQVNSGDKRENAFTPKVDLSYQIDPNRPVLRHLRQGISTRRRQQSGAAGSLLQDFNNFGITQAPATYSSDTVDSYEIGAKNNFDNRMRIATSIYYIQWHNIQQRIVPPICQISFIANLGTGGRQGCRLSGRIRDHRRADRRADRRLHRGALHTRFRVHDQSGAARPFRCDTAPIVESGDAIIGESGQPIPPVTASPAWSITSMRSRTNRSCGRTMNSRAVLGGCHRSRTLARSCTIPAISRLSSTSFVSLRGGMKFGEMQLEPFIDNLLERASDHQLQLVGLSGTRYQPPGDRLYVPATHLRAHVHFPSLRSSSG
jgi:hypothetical protein